MNAFMVVNNMTLAKNYLPIIVKIQIIKWDLVTFTYSLRGLCM